MVQSRFAKHGVVFLKLAVTVFLFYLILQNVDFTKFVETIRDVRPGFLVLVCLLYPVGLAMGAVKLQGLLAGYKLPIAVGTAFDLNWIGGFFNNFLPSTVGGDVYRLVFLNRQYPADPAQVVSTIIIDRGLGLLTVLLLAGLTSTVFFGDLIESIWMITAFYSVVAVVALLSGFVLFVRHNLRIAYNTKSLIINKLVNGVNILINYPDKAALRRALALSFLLWILVVASNYLLFLAFNSDVSLLVLFFVIPVVSLAAMVPISINGLGVTEGAGIVLFRHFGFEPELILSIFLTGRILLILCSATGGIRFLARRNLI